MSDMDNLRPNMRMVKIGIREYEDLEIWPLSMADQLDLSKIIDAAVSTVVSESENEFLFIMVIKRMIEENIGVLLQKVTDYDTDAKLKKLLKKITNDQFIEICEAVYEMNFEKLSKKVTRLLGVMTSLPLGRLSPTLSSDTQDTGSSISPDSASETEA